MTIAKYAVSIAKKVDKLIKQHNKLLPMYLAAQKELRYLENLDEQYRAELRRLDNLGPEWFILSETLDGDQYELSYFVNEKDDDVQSLENALHDIEDALETADLDLEY